MEPEVQSQLNQLLESLRIGLEKTGNMALEQMPLVAHDIAMWVGGKVVSWSLKRKTKIYHRY